MRDAGDVFLDSFVPIVERRRDEPWGERERDWQLYRRGRYVEFNLLYDRGTTAFGLKTSGRASNLILMSLPPLASWRFDFHPGAWLARAEPPRFPQADGLARGGPESWWVEA